MNLLNILTTIVNSIGLLECISVVFFSILVLQEVLSRCSTGLRIVFTIFPVAAILNMIDFMMLHHNYSGPSIVLYFGVLLSLNWIWHQRNLFHKFEHILIENTKKHRGFFSIDELKCIICCVAVSALKQVGCSNNVALSVCTKLNEDKLKLEFNYYEEDLL